MAVNAIDNTTETDATDTPTERESDEARIERIAAKFEAEDAKLARGASSTGEDGTDEESEEGEENDGEEGEDDDAAGDTADDADEHADDASAEDSDDSDATTDDDDETTDPDDQETESEGEGSDDDDAAEGEGDGSEDGAAEDEEDLGITDETRTALERRGIDPKFLADVPEAQRATVAKLVEKKVAAVDRAFTQEMQERTRYRDERRQFMADQQYRDANPDLVIVEMLRKGGKALFDKVDSRLAKLDPNTDGNDETSIADYEAALTAQIKDKRRDASEAVTAAEQDYSRRVERADAIEKSARTAARKAGVPFGATLEKLIAGAIKDKPKDQQDLSDEEVTDIVADYAKEHLRSTRAHRREESKRSVQERAKAKLKPKATATPVRSAASPIASKKKPPQGTLEQKMMATARRLAPGVPDE